MSRIAGIVEAISAQGAQLVDLPPYSPDLNPIEQAFAKFMAALRRAAERSREGLWQAIDFGCDGRFLLKGVWTKPNPMAGRLRSSCSPAPRCARRRDPAPLIHRRAGDRMGPLLRRGTESL